MGGEWVSDCAHYYVDPSGGFGWPSCVKCGEDAPSTSEPARSRRYGGVRPCCQTTEEQGHVSTCQSVDARQRRGLPGLRGAP